MKLDLPSISSDRAGALVQQAMDLSVVSHSPPMQMLDIVDLEAGTAVAGGRGYYLKREGVMLNQVWEAVLHQSVHTHMRYS